MNLRFQVNNRNIMGNISNYRQFLIEITSSSSLESAEAKILETMAEVKVRSLKVEATHFDLED